MKGTKDIAKIATPHSVVAHMVSPEEQAAADKILRDKIPRKHHGEWNEVNGRPNPIDFLHKSDATSPMANSSRCGSCTTQRSKATR